MAKSVRRVLKTALKKSKNTLRKKRPAPKKSFAKKKTSRVLSPPALPVRSIESVFLPDKASFSLPSGYGEDKAVLLVKDPWWLFAYWEVTASRQSQVWELIERQGFHREKTVLRVYDITGTSIDLPNSFFDIELNFFANQWHIDAGKPDRQWVIEVGMRTHEGRFFMLVRSNTVRTPRFGISDVIDEEWMLPDDLYQKLLGTLDFARQKSSWNLQKDRSSLSLLGKK